MNSIVAIAPRAQLNCYKPSAAEERYVEQGRTFLNMIAQFWSSIFYSKMSIAFTHDVPYAATDSYYIYVNVPAMMKEGWTFEEVTFVIAHEVMHYILAHLVMSVHWRNQSEIILPDGSTLPYDHMLMNCAMDYGINAALIDGKIGKMPSIGLYDKTLSAKGMEGCVEIYAKLWAKLQQEKKQQGGQEQAQPSQPGGSGEVGHGGFDVHLDPSAETMEAEAQTGTLDRAQAIAAAKMVAEAAGMGELPAAIRQLIGDILEPRVKWNDHLKTSMHRAAGEPRHDWAKLNKRLISRPNPWGKIAFAGRSNYGCGTVVVGYDTSGSCVNPETQQRFFSEMAGIVGDLNPERLIVIWCDAKVQRVDDLESPEDLEDLRMEINELGGAPGGGGTDLRKIFDHIRDEHIEPDMLVVLTDMYTPFPTDVPDYHTIWASITSNGPAAPFGELVEVGAME
jgi:predicted metal-dependent peptidase